MKHLITALLLTFTLNNAYAFDIVAFGTSATNCRGVSRGQIFPVKLEELLRQDGLEVRVVNAGVDGDRPVWMVNRIKTVLTPETKLVIFEPGPNERNPNFALPYIEEVLGYLKDQNMPVLYASTIATQTVDEAKVTADKFNAYYYGYFSKNVPTDSTHRQFDYPSPWGGHMTAEGCAVVAKSMAPVIKEIIKKNNIH